MNFILAPSAILDLNRLSDYFLVNNIEAGERLFSLLNKAFYNLTQFPNIGRSYPHLDPTIYGLLVEKYVVFYRVTSTEVEIVYVVDGRKNLNALFHRDE